MEKIRLLKDLWNHKKGETIEVSTIMSAFALRKKYAEPIETKLKPKKAKVKTNATENKAILKAPENKFVGHKNIKQCK